MMSEGSPLNNSHLSKIDGNNKNVPHNMNSTSSFGSPLASNHKHS